MGRVQSDVVVADPLMLDDDAGLGQGGEEFLVQALVSEPAVEAFHEAVLLRPAGRDVMPVDATLGGPAGSLGWSSQSRCRRR